MCEYTSHGHCGILNHGYVDNDKTLEYLAKIALSHAAAGRTWWHRRYDGRQGGGNPARVGQTQLYQYAYHVICRKYSSSFYGPFRDAAKSAPSFGTGSHTKWTITTKEAVKEALTI